jgi:endoglycosylceramidase
MVNWGFNFMRLGVMWEAVERAPGVYNTTYLEEVNSLITRLGEYGIYTLVDAHQDVFARKICGEGMPDFYLPDDKLNHKCEGSAV